MRLCLTSTFLAQDREALILSAASANHYYEVVIDRKTRVPRYSSDSDNARMAACLMAVAVKYETRALLYLDTPPFTFNEQRAERCTLPERSKRRNDLEDLIAQERI